MQSMHYVGLDVARSSFSPPPGTRGAASRFKGHWRAEAKLNQRNWQ
jgi:hypothetical protein